MIYGRFGDPLTIVRRAKLDDVERLDGRKPDAVDVEAVKHGNYVVATYHDDGRESLQTLAFLKADDGWKEIEAALAGLEA